MPLSRSKTSRDGYLRTARRADTRQGQDPHASERSSVDDYCSELTPKSMRIVLGRSVAGTRGAPSRCGGHPSFACFVDPVAPGPEQQEPRRTSSSMRPSSKLLDEACGGEHKVRGIGQPPASGVWVVGLEVLVFVAVGDDCFVFRNGRDYRSLFVVAVRQQDRQPSGLDAGVDGVDVELRGL